MGALGWLFSIGAAPLLLLPPAGAMGSSPNASHCAAAAAAAARAAAVASAEAAGRFRAPLTAPGAAL
eukprot:2217339-Pyramimonas_sp.AAC.1